MIEYKASLDSLTKVLTALVLVIVGILLWKGIMIIPASKNPIRISISAGFLICIAVLFIAYFYRTKGYIIMDDELIIERPVGKKKLKLQEITETKLLSE